MVYVQVRVVDKSGAPESSVDVAIEQLGIFGGFTSNSTDSSGLATFELDMSSSDKMKVHVRGSVRYEGYPQAKIMVTV